MKCCRWRNGNMLETAPLTATFKPFWVLKAEQNLRVKGEQDCSCMTVIICLKKIIPASSSIVTSRNDFHVFQNFLPG